MEITLTVDQANIVLNALSQRPFVEVADLIFSIRQQANVQLQAAPAAPENDGSE